MEPLPNVRYYTRYIARIPVYFPNGKEQCKYCVFLRYEHPFSRFYCKAVLGGNWVEAIAGRPEWCPLQSEEEEKNR